MDAEVNAPAILVSLLVLGILAGSGLLWYRQSNNQQITLYPPHPIPAWSIGWVNFGIFMCALVTFVVFSQQVGVTLFSKQIEAADGELTPWIAILAVLMLQVPMLLVFYGARRFYPGLFAGSLNERSLSIVQAFKLAAPSFIMFLPIIWFASLTWGFLLEQLQSLGYIESLSPQELVTLFSSGGSGLPIVILIFCAVVVAPVVEEIIFRGCIYRFLKSQTVTLIAQIISGLLFGLLHGNLLSFAPLVIVGIILAKVYERSGNILVPICFHAYFNAFNLILLLVLNPTELPS